MDEQKKQAGMSVTTARSGRSRQAHIPTILLKETPVDPSVFDRRDPLEKLIDKNREKVTQSSKSFIPPENYTGYDEDFEESQKRPSKRIDVSKMSLDHFLTKYTSEDNQSFQHLHDQDREDFIKKIGWMFNENEKYTKLNQLAIKNGTNSQKMLVQDGTKVRTLPAIQMGDHEP